MGADQNAHLRSLISAFVKRSLESLTLKAPRKKMHLKMSAAEVVCFKYLPNITDKLSIEANSADPDQTAPIGAVWSGSTLFALGLLKHFSRREKQTPFVAIGALRSNSCTGYNVMPRFKILACCCC